MELVDVDRLTWPLCIFDDEQRRFLICIVASCIMKRVSRYISQLPAVGPNLIATARFQ